MCGQAACYQCVAHQDLDGPDSPEATAPLWSLATSLSSCCILARSVERASVYSWFEPFLAGFSSFHVGPDSTLLGNQYVDAASCEEAGTSRESAMLTSRRLSACTSQVLTASFTYVWDMYCIYEIKYIDY